MIALETQKFTENTLSVRRLLPLERENITAWNLLVYMLSGRSEKYPTRQEASAAVSHAYGVQGGHFLSAIGHSLQLEYRLTWIRESLISEPGYDEEIEDLFDQFLFHPLLTEEVLEESRWLLKNRLQTLAQDPESKATRMALETAGEGTDLSIPMQGDLEEVDRVTLDQIRELYERFRKAPVEVLYAGECAGQTWKRLKKLPGQHPLSLTWSALTDREQPAVCVIEKEISQSALVQVYSTSILPQDPLYMPLLVLYSLLGSSSVALFFEEIREKRSLCYSISTSLIRFDGVMLVSAGTDRQFMDEVRGQIARIIEETAAGKIDARTLERVKSELADNMRGQNDYRVAMIEQQWLNQILDRPMSVDQTIEAIQAVSVAQVAQAAGGLKLAAEGIVLQKETREECE